MRHRSAFSTSSLRKRTRETTIVEEEIDVNEKELIESKRVWESPTARHLGQLVQLASTLSTCSSRASNSKATKVTAPLCDEMMKCRESLWRCYQRVAPPFAAFCADSDHADLTDLEWSILDQWMALSSEQQAEYRSRLESDDPSRLPLIDNRVWTSLGTGASRLLSCLLHCHGCALYLEHHAPPKNIQTLSRQWWLLWQRFFGDSIRVDSALFPWTEPVGLPSLSSLFLGERRTSPDPMAGTPFKRVEDLWKFHYHPCKFDEWQSRQLQIHSAEQLAWLRIWHQEQVRLLHASKAAYKEERSDWLASMWHQRWQQYARHVPVLPTVTIGLETSRMDETPLAVGRKREEKRASQERSKQNYHDPSPLASNTDWAAIEWSDLLQHSVDLSHSILPMAIHVTLVVDPSLLHPAPEIDAQWAWWTLLIKRVEMHVGKRWTLSHLLIFNRYPNPVQELSEQCASDNTSPNHSIETEHEITSPFDRARVTQRHQALVTLLERADEWRWVKLDESDMRLMSVADWLLFAIEDWLRRDSFEWKLKRLEIFPGLKLSALQCAALGCLVQRDCFSSIRLLTQHSLFRTTELEAATSFSRALVSCSSLVRLTISSRHASRQQWKLWASCCPSICCGLRELVVGTNFALRADVARQTWKHVMDSHVLRHLERVTLPCVIDTQVESMLCAELSHAVNLVSLRWVRPVDKPYHMSSSSSAACRCLIVLERLLNPSINPACTFQPHNITFHRRCRMATLASSLSSLPTDVNKPYIRLSTERPSLSIPFADWNDSNGHQKQYLRRIIALWNGVVPQVAPHFHVQLGLSVASLSPLQTIIQVEDQPTYVGIMERHRRHTRQWRRLAVVIAFCRSLAVSAWSLTRSILPLVPTIERFVVAPRVVDLYPDAVVLH